MTEWSYQSYDLDEVYRPSLPRKIFVRTAPVVAAFTFSALVALRLAGGLAEEAYAPTSSQEAALAPENESAQAPFAELRRQAPERELAQAPQAVVQAPQAVVQAPQAVVQAPPAAPKANSRVAYQAPAISAPNPVAATPYGALFDPEGSLVGAPALMADSAPIGPAFSPLQSEPLFVLMDPVEPGAQVAEAESEPVEQTAQAEQTSPPADKQAQEAASASATLALVMPPPRPDLTEKPPQQMAEAEIGAPVPPIRPSELTIQPRVVEAPAPVPAPPARAVVEIAPPRGPEIAPPRAPENATPRLSPRAAARANAREQAQAATLAQNGQQNSFFDKLFGGLQEKGQQLAYASPEGGGALRLSRGVTSSPSPFAASGGTAVYDIAAHTVYLPNGQALEAHSGLGPYFDDPEHVHLRMRGATPPAVYELKLRESLFHGVQALRLTPVSGSTYGRNGLLAHTFMLGQRGDSNGCVSFRNYRAFLQAYLNGEVRRLVVVSRR